MKVPFLDLQAAASDIAPEIEAALVQAARSGQYIMGPILEQFEAEFACYTGAAHCLGVANGLDALRLGLQAMGIGAGDEVIVPANTFIATWLAVSQCGAVPVPVEPIEATHNIDPDAVADAITPKTKAILAVHLYGQPADLDALQAVADRHNLPLLQDAAQAHGARYKSKPLGTMGTATFSFYPSKNLGALGDGGALVTNDASVAHHLKLLRNYGSEEKYVHELKGQNSRLDPLQAAVLSHKLRVLDDWNAKRQAIARRYSDAFAKAGATIPFVPDWADPVWHLYVLRHADRDQFQNRLTAAGVATAIHYPIPPHLQKAYSDMGYEPGRFPLSETLAKEVISLPMCPAQTDEQTDYVIDTVLNLL
ncbi:DegT/DnrJ/EryC1/StrS family aminotransferase [Pseudophaeobacter flagellatus]|uniref:DegT/DnrJ/EryC1/StrS family aminotransferase n=1 Tax=Pseudophaeobacter flagellatus TaxID=2899119 RepID=UPI001E5D2D5F|nr:DegT/DnrJ/EryC1/StrS family aminotransferase [Pseudophaeobacter flagellatus]MCD9150045.1 DegT/DnrJ/EryC1/StrS family aminotransferase [Pseudophaeobacter flagellatus]